MIINEEILHSSTELCFCPVNDNLFSIFAKKRSTLQKMLTYIFILWIAIQIEQIPPYTCVNNFIRFMNLKEW